MKLWELFESKKDYENRQESLLEDLSDPIHDEVEFNEGKIKELDGFKVGQLVRASNPNATPKWRIDGFTNDGKVVIHNTRKRGQGYPVKDPSKGQMTFPMDRIKRANPDELIEGAKMVWRRKGNKVVKGYRCTTGRKKGRLVDTPADCSKTIDLKKRFRMKKMLKQKGTRIRRKAIKTKNRNPVSMRLARMNKANRKKL